jgi:hypothetical protein
LRSYVDLQTGALLPITDPQWFYENATCDSGNPMAPEWYVDASAPRASRLPVGFHVEADAVPILVEVRSMRRGSYAPCETVPPCTSNCGLTSAEGQFRYVLPLAPQDLGRPEALDGVVLPLTLERKGP